MSSGSEKRSSNAYTAACNESSHGILFARLCALAGSSTDRPLEAPRLAISSGPTSPSDSVDANLAVILMRSYGGSGNGKMIISPPSGMILLSPLIRTSRTRLVYCSE